MLSDSIIGMCNVYEGMLNEAKDVVGNLGDERMRSC